MVEEQIVAESEGNVSGLSRREGGGETAKVGSEWREKRNKERLRLGFKEREKVK